ncbi:MAG TPA: hypothetical protein VGO47_13065 [Chlamydiales bacterium]|nr:hypothetical protein [Chlamydiales bacterium]
MVKWISLLLLGELNLDHQLEIESVWITIHNSSLQAGVEEKYPGVSVGQTDISTGQSVYGVRLSENYESACA